MYSGSILLQLDSTRLLLFFLLLLIVLLILLLLLLQLLLLCLLLKTLLCFSVCMLSERVRVLFWFILRQTFMCPVGDSITFSKTQCKETIEEIRKWKSVFTPSENVNKQEGSWPLQSDWFNSIDCMMDCWDLGGVHGGVYPMLGK